MKWILHHYDFSNFSEKIRLVLGLKGVAWDSVTIPSHLPKPDYTPLTGGYRRTPALQIGADIYCDTRLIADVIESEIPTPSIYPGAARTKTLARAVADWAESRMLWPTALYVTGIHAERFALEFHLDRAVLHGKPAPDIAKVKASARKYLAQMRSELSGIEALFSDEKPYVLGEAVSLADIAVYQIPWFLDVIDPGHAFLAEMPHTRAWMERIAALGHGQVGSIEPHAAIEIANAATPLSSTSKALAIPEGYAVGDNVKVSPLDENSPASGMLAYADDHRITIRLDNDRVHDVRVHFPRSGYKLSKM